MVRSYALILCGLAVTTIAVQLASVGRVSIDRAGLLQDLAAVLMQGTAVMLLLRIRRRTAR